jgi:peptidoglycan-associated lipoprotein
MRFAGTVRELLREFPSVQVFLEGHCDERGSAEYNLGLGDRRARRAAEVLVQFGLPPKRLQTVSYGNEAPQCSQSTESCWRLNRRAHLVIRRSQPEQ